jgi:hypothetical protein
VKPHETQRKKHTRHGSVALVVAVKVVIVVLVLALPSGVALSLGAAHGVALVLVAVAAVVLLVVKLVRRGSRRMLTAETTIQTANASRYLVQLCQHATKFGDRIGQLHSPVAHARPEVLDVECAETHGVLTLSWGRCVLDADPTGLAVRVEADSEENLRGIQDLITADLERFGQRDHLTVDEWCVSRPVSR